MARNWKQRADDMRRERDERIRRMSARGRSALDIAHTLGITRQRVYQILAEQQAAAAGGA